MDNKEKIEKLEEIKKMKHKPMTFEDMKKEAIDNLCYDCEIVNHCVVYKNYIDFRKPKPCVHKKIAKKIYD